MSLNYCFGSLLCYAVIDSYNTARVPAAQLPQKKEREPKGSAALQRGDFADLTYRLHIQHIFALPLYVIAIYNEALPDPLRGASLPLRSFG